MQPLYTFETLKTASSKVLIAEINNQLSQLEAAGGLDKPHHALRAQLLIQVLAARTQNRQNLIMIICTFLITIMTAVILYLTLVMVHRA